MYILGSHPYLFNLSTWLVRRECVEGETDRASKNVNKTNAKQRDEQDLDAMGFALVSFTMTNIDDETGFVFVFYTSRIKTCNASATCPLRMLCLTRFSFLDNCLSSLLISKVHGVSGQNTDCPRVRIFFFSFTAVLFFSSTLYSFTYLLFFHSSFLPFILSFSIVYNECTGHR